MKIVALVENTAKDAGLSAEHGLSLHVTTQDRALLFDMGASDTFIRNARVLGVDLNLVETAIISHAHYDHGGGLKHFLKINDKAMVYLMEGATGDYYANIGAKLPLWLHGTAYPLVSHSLLFSRYIGLDKALFQTHSNRIRLMEKNAEIQKNISILARTNGEFPLAEGNKFLLQKSDGRLNHDRFTHELVLVIEEPDGLVVFTGCGHGGILNMVTSVRNAHPERPIKAVVGGFHLAFQPGKPAIAGMREDIERIGIALLKTGVNNVYTGHCTGDEAYAILKDVMGEKLGRLYTGARINL